MLLVFFLFLALFVLAQDLAGGIDLDAPFLAALLDNGFVILSLFLPADNLAAGRFFLRGFLDGRRDIRALQLFFFVFFCERKSRKRQSAADRHCRCDYFFHM